MTDKIASPQGIHLVGSTTFKSRQEHFHEVGTRLGPYLHSLSDGETDPPTRGYWTACQILAFEAAGATDLLRQDGRSRLGLGPIDDSARISEDDVGSLLDGFNVKYDEWAIASYQQFKKSKEEGILPAHLKFQVNLPTPMSACAFVVDSRYRAAVDAPYEAALIRALRNIQDQIPHDELVFQFEAVAELFFLEVAWTKDRRYDFSGGSSIPWFTDDSDIEAVQAYVLERFGRYLNSGYVDADVEVGIHLCYGDQGHKHFAEPRDTAHLAEMVSQIIDKKNRSIQYVHLPVPKERDDEAYLNPLQAIWSKMKEHGTYLYLGLVHAGDKEGTLRRIETARKVLGDDGWGVASECGLGRTPDIGSVLEISTEVAQPWR